MSDTLGSWQPWAAGQANCGLHQESCVCVGMQKCVRVCTGGGVFNSSARVDSDLFLASRVVGWVPPVPLGPEESFHGTSSSF